MTSSVEFIQDSQSTDLISLRKDQTNSLTIKQLDGNVSNLLDLSTSTTDTLVYRTWAGYNTDRPLYESSPIPDPTLPGFWLEQGTMSAYDPFSQHLMQDPSELPYVIWGTPWYTWDKIKTNAGRIFPLSNGWINGGYSTWSYTWVGGIPTAVPGTDSIYYPPRGLAKVINILYQW